MTESIELPSRLDLPYAQKLLQDISARDLSGGITLDAKEVTHFGALCVQVVLSAARAVLDAGGEFKVENVSDRADSQLGVMGLTIETLAEGAR